MLLADSGLGERAIPLLVAARGADRAPPTSSASILRWRAPISDLERWTELREVATRLVAAVPNSAQAFRYQQWRDLSSGNGMRWKKPRASGWRACRTIRWRARSWCAAPRRAASSGEISRHHAAADRQRPRHGVRLQPVRVDRAADAVRLTSARWMRRAWRIDETQGKSFAIASYARLCVCRHRQAARGARPVAQGHGDDGHRPVPMTPRGMASDWWPRRMVIPSPRATTTRRWRSRKRA